MHFCSNLAVVGAKPEQVTLGWRKKEFGIDDLIRCIRRIARVFRPIIFALKNQGRSGNPAEVSALMVDIMKKARTGARSE